MFVIAGVTGNTGSVVARTLLDQGQSVRVIVRDAAKGASFAARGAQVFVGALEDPIQLARALEGATGAYLLVPPDVTHPAQVSRGRRLTESFIEALTRTPIPHVALLSSLGAQHPTGTGPIQSLHYAEVRLGALPKTRLTSIRAGYFMENLGSGLSPAREQGVLPALFSPTRKIDMVATLDIGVAAAHALRETPSANRILDVVGPEPFSYAQAAEILSELLKRSVSPFPVPAEAIVPALTGAGLSADMAGLYAEMAGAIDAGKLTHEGRLVRGKTTLREVLTKLVG